MRFIRLLLVSIVTWLAFVSIGCTDANPLSPSALRSGSAGGGGTAISADPWLQRDYIVYVEPD